MSDKKHIGTNFDSFLAEENILQEAEIIAKKSCKCIYHRTTVQ